MLKENNRFSKSGILHKARKKAQLKIQEMSFMLLALVLFFVIAGLFFLVITNADIKRSYERLAESKAVSVISQIADTPELACGTGEQLCVDTDKLLVLKESDAFSGYWDIEGGLVVKKLYPAVEGEIECGIGNYQACNTFTLRQKSEGYIEISSYVALCRKESSGGYSYDKCEFGKISAYLEKEGE